MARAEPLDVRLSRAKLRALEPRHDPAFPDRLIEEHLRGGDGRAAVVVQRDPPVVAAYAGELDGVVLLRFPPAFAQEYGLEVGARLLTVNTYQPRRDGLEPDLIPGERDTGDYGNVYPCIAELLSDDLEVIERRKAAIDEAEWKRTERLGRQALRERSPTRRGGPYTSGRAGRPASRAAGGPAPAAAEHRDAEVEARARIAWGHDRARVEAFLRERGVPPARIEVVLASAGAQRDQAFRRRALVDFGLAAIVGGVPLYAWVRAGREGGVVSARQLFLMLVAGFLIAQGTTRLLFGGWGEGGAEHAPDPVHELIFRRMRILAVLAVMIVMGLVIADWLD